MEGVEPPRPKARAPQTRVAAITPHELPVPKTGVKPARPKAPDPKSGVSVSSTTSAIKLQSAVSESNRILLLFREALMATNLAHSGL
jgi:hypothetical protein